MDFAKKTAIVFKECILIYPCLTHSFYIREDQGMLMKKAAYVHAKSFQLCLTLCNPMDCSPPGSSVHGILLARILQWVVMSSSRGSS